MEGGLLVASNLSSIYATSHSPVVTVHTERRPTNFSKPRLADPIAEHATDAAVLHTPATDTVLLRVIDSGYVLELLSLGSNVPPLRFLFPSPVLSKPALFLWDPNEIHILAVTQSASLHRLIVPFSTLNDLWRNTIGSVEQREYLIRHSTTLNTMVHVQGTDCVIVALPHGSLLRLEADFAVDEASWSETVFKPGSYWPSFLLSSSDNRSDIVSIATHSWPTDIGHVWTMSRDGTLRFWKSRQGCIATKHISTSMPSREPTPSSNEPRVLLDAEPQTLLRVFSVERREDHFYVLVYIPPPPSSASGGTFHLLDTTRDQIVEIGTINCSRRSSHSHLQDFTVIESKIYTLWDQQGQSVLERMEIDVTDLSKENFRPTFWVASCYHSEPELTPSYVEQILSAPGSLTDKFMDVILRPGVFSPLTLQTAIEQYKSIYADNKFGNVPPQLTSTYSTVAESIAAIVGCTVQLNRDPGTGAIQYGNYWSALKRDWEGFLARCREIERGARWPLVLGAQGSGENEVIVIERERVGALVPEDYPLWLRRSLDGNEEVQHDLIPNLWTFRRNIDPAFVLSVEQRLMDILQQEAAFSYADIIRDQARRFSVQKHMDAGAASWMIGRLQSIKDIEATIRATLDDLAALTVEVKVEEEEVELLLPVVDSEWFRALAASYVSITTNARYDICLSLMLLLLFLSDEVEEWEPGLLAEVFAMYRGLAVLRYVSRQPAGETSRPRTIDNADDVVQSMRNLGVSRPQTDSFVPSHSLMHRLLAQTSDTTNLPGSAHRFLETTGLLQSVTPAAATMEEVAFCDRLRSLGYHTPVREILSWLPRTPAITYLNARVAIDVGKGDEAALLLESLASGFGPEKAVTSDDQKALEAVLPIPLDSEFAFHIHASTLFKMNGLIAHEVAFTRKAISCAPDEAETSDLWISMIRAYIDLRMYDEAIASLGVSPHEKLKRDCVTQLVYRICEDQDGEKLTAENFAGFLDEVEDALSFKARNADPRARPTYSKILYGWYISRGDYRNAALVMYQHARKLREIASDALQASSVAQEQLTAYSVAINAMVLLDEENPWILVPTTVEHLHEPRKRRKTSKYIPDSKYSAGTRDDEIVYLSDMRYDLTLLTAQIELLQTDSELTFGDVLRMQPPAIILRLAQEHRFEAAMKSARSLDADMTEIFMTLTSQCLRLSRSPDLPMNNSQSDWLLTDSASSWQGTPADRGWRFLRRSLESHDGQENDFGYAKAALESILSFAEDTEAPVWLVKMIEDHHPEFLVRVHLRYGKFNEAIEYSMKILKKNEPQTRTSSRAGSSWIPYSLIEQVIVAASAAQPQPKALSDLRSQISERFTKIRRAQVVH